MNGDFKDYLSVQRHPVRKFVLRGRTSRKMAEELIQLIEGDRDRIPAILADLPFCHPDRSIDWYFDRVTIK
jgi:hypothetical protein